MLLLTLRDLQHRLLRFLVVVLATAVVFTLLLLMSGLVRQFEDEPRNAVAAFGAESWILPAGSSGAFTSAAALDPRAAAEVEVAGRADPLALARHTMLTDDVRHDVVLAGFTPGGLGSPTVSRGRVPTGAGELALSVSADVEIGGVVEVGDRSLTVTGLLEDTTVLAGVPLGFLPLAALQELVYGGAPVVTALLADGAAVHVPEGLHVLGNDAVADDVRRPLERAIGSLHLVRALLWLVAAMIVGAVVYLSAMERQRDIAVLKAVGSSVGALLGGLAAQGVLVAVVAALLASGLAVLLAPLFPLQVSLSPPLFVQLPVLAALVALASSGAGLRRVQRADPATAFAGPAG